MAETSESNVPLKPIDQMPGPAPGLIEKIVGGDDLHFIKFTSIEPYLEYAQEYGDLCHFTLRGRGPYGLVTNADYCKQIFETPEFASRTLDPYIGHTYGVAAGYSDDRYFPALSNDNSEYWRVKREFVNKFIQPTYPKYIAYFNERAKELVAQLKSEGKEQHQFKVSPYFLFRRWVFEMIGEVLFGKEDFNRNPAGKDSFFESVSYWLDHFIKFVPFKYPYKDIISSLMVKSLNKQMAHSHDFLSEILQHKKEHQFGDDWMSILSTNEIEGKRLSDDDVKLMCLDMMNGCVGPTPFLLDYGLFALAKFGYVQEKLHVEHKKVMGDRTDLTSEDIHKMPYLSGTAMELLRIYPAGGGINVRTCNQDNVPFQGYNIPKDMTFIINVYALHVSPLYWNEPHNLDPTRWDPDVPKTPYAFQTFGGGVKGCPGKDFMVLFTNVIVSHLVQSFDILEEGGNPTVLFELVARTKEPLTHHLQVRIA